ncbi:MAG: amidohydrolase [Coriobacteriia bacterium]|nr:amidohydrolase [Coriobacteriia bacterium]
MDAEQFIQAADEIWDNPETGLEEYNTQDIHCKLLEEYGFEVERGISQLETSYLATWGSGGPVIAFLSEMDALEGLSQKADISEKEADPNMTAGHACGHHLLGAGVVMAAVQYKEYLEQHSLKGTIKVFGCPCEETGSGKGYIARDGYFDDCDVALTWHPSIINIVSTGSTLACIQLTFKFTGVSSHAAVAPHLGRSALDAVELTNVGCNYLREHMTMTDRIHYAVLNTGGENPGIVQQDAEVRYLVRSHNNLDCLDLMTRVIDCARGAALMTGCKMRFQIEDAACNMVSNETLEDAIRDVFKDTELPTYSKEEIDYLYQYYNKDAAKALVNMLPPFIKDRAAVKENIKSMPINTTYIESSVSNFVGPASTDVGDVSWNVPTGIINTACFAYGTQGHSWQWVAQGKSSPAHKGMLLAAEIMFKTAVKLNRENKLIIKIKEEFATKMKDQEYKTALPKIVPVKQIKGRKKEQ